MPVTSGKGRVALLSLGVAAAGVALALWLGDREGDPPGEPGGGAEEPSGGPGAGWGAGLPGEARRGRPEAPVPDAGRSAPVRGGAIAVEGPQAPGEDPVERPLGRPSRDERASGSSPGTAISRLEEAERMAEALALRSHRLGQDLEAARRGGREDEVRRLENLLARTRLRAERLDRETEALRGEAAQESDGR